MTAPSDTPERPMTKLANALFDIVEKQVNSLMSCRDVSNATQCFILTGPRGEKGSLGPRGPVGEKGDTGQQGMKGEIGQKGDTGMKGEIGQKGESGQPGMKGARGPKGDTGQQGLKGELGQKGEKGDMGDEGLQGPAGPPGIDGQGVIELGQDGCSWQYTDTCAHRCGISLQRVTCPSGQYVAGFGIRTFHDLGRYDTHILCCPVSSTQLNDE